MDKTRQERLDEQNRLLARQEEIMRILEKFPNVAGTAVGVKEIGGKMTDEIVIRVYVHEKKPLGELQPYEIIPSEIDGIKIDVKEMHRNLSGCSDTREFRPMIGGSQITSSNTDYNGTLGCFAIDNLNPGSIVMLSNYHVLMYSGEKPGHPVAQSDFTCCDNCCCRCGEVAQVVRGSDFHNPNEYLDCAIARLSNGFENSYVNEIFEIGPISGIAPNFAVNDHVFKRGKTTLLQEGIITAVGVTTPTPVNFGSGDNRVTKTFLNHFEIGPLPGGNAFSHKGDSGSVIVNADNQAVGLLFGDDSKDNPYRAATVTLANDMNAVVAKLNITIPNTGTLLSIPLRSEGTANPVLANDPPLRRLEKMIESEENGALLINMFHQHSKEIMSLIRNNRDVKVAWNRFKGPVFTAHLVEKSKNPDHHFPEEIEGYTSLQLLLKMSTVLEKNGSAALSGDIEAYGTDVIKLFQKISREQLAMTN